MSSPMLLFHANSGILEDTSTALARTPSGLSTVHVDLLVTDV